jgi:glycerate 2-kinase
MTRVVIAPDGFGGTLSASDAAEAIAEGWRAARPADELVLLPLSDGGEGLLDVLAAPGDTWHTVEVAGPLGHPLDAAFLERSDGRVIIESARVCGLALVPPERRTPRMTTTYGVGQLLDAARRRGARHILVGLGGTATVDGGAGALTALGFRPTVADGSGLKIGGDDLHRVTAIGADWSADWSGVEIEVLADVTTPLTEAAQSFGPQKGASPDDVEHLRIGLERWAEVVERDLVAAAGTGRTGRVARGQDTGPSLPLREQPGTGAAGGLGFALSAALGARIVVGSEAVGELVGLPDAIASADVVVTGEGQLDATTGAGEIVSHVTSLARSRGVPVHAVVGRLGPGAPDLDDVQQASPGGSPVEPAADVRAAAGRSAAVWSP